jgi:hypothetical protein
LDDSEWSLPAFFAKMAQIFLIYPRLRHCDEYFRGAGVGTMTYGEKKQPLVSFEMISHHRN